MINVELIGKSQKGKNRVRENGKKWLIHEQREKVIFSSEKGPWVFISPEGKNKNDKASRWVNLKNDFDFEVVIN